MAKQLSSSSKPTAGPDGSTKPLPRGPHTVQLLFHFAVHSVLILLSCLILPAHLLSRSSEAEPKPDILSSTKLLFSLSDSPENVAQWSRIVWGVVQAVGLAQAWAMIRLRKWWDLGRAIEKGDRAQAREVTNRGWMKGAELLTVTSINLPGAVALIQVVLVLLGAPATSKLAPTLQFSILLAFVLYLPLAHLSPSLLSSPSLFPFTTPTKTATSTRSSINPDLQGPRPLVLSLTLFFPLVASFLASACLTFDHEKAWQQWPVPGVIALCLGQMIGNLVAAVSYLLGYGEQL